MEDKKTTKNEQHFKIKQNDKIIEYADVQFEVEGQIVYAIKTHLFLTSPVFERMFQGEFKEKYDCKTKTIPLPDKSFNDMVKLMDIIHYRNAEVNEYNVKSVIDLADEYECKAILDECERFLCNSDMLEFDKSQYRCKRNEAGIKVHKSCLGDCLVHWLVKATSLNLKSLENKTTELIQYVDYSYVKACTLYDDLDPVLKVKIMEPRVELCRKKHLKQIHRY